MRSPQKRRLGSAAALGLVVLAGCSHGDPGCDLCEAPLLATQTTSLAFGGVPIGQAVTLTLQLENEGLAATGIGLRFNGGVGFELDAGLPASLSPGATATVGITFAPTAAGEAAAVATIQSNSESGPLSVRLSGEGVATGWICPSPLSLEFGAVPVGGALSQHLDLAACGTSPTELAAVTIANPDAGFSVSGPPFGPIAAGQSAAWTVTFAPTATGSVSTGLAFSLCSGCDPSQPIPVTGIGVDGLAFSPDPLSFGTFPAGQSRSQMVTATNMEAAPLTLLSLSLYSRGDPAFTLQVVPSLPLTLDAGTSLTFTVEDSPTAATGATKSDVLATYTVGTSTTQLTADLFMSGGGT